MEIRDAGADDLPGLLAIYNEVIATSTAIYTEQSVTLDDRVAWWNARITQGYQIGRAHV